MVRMSLVVFGTILASAGCRATERPPDAPAGPAPRADCTDPIDDALLADHVATAGFTRGVPEPVAIGPDGTVVFRRTGPRDGVAALFELAPGGSAAQLAKPDQCMSMFRATDGVAVIDAADDASRILIRTGGAFCVVGHGRRAIDHTAFMPGVDGTEPCGPDLEQHLSPDGQRLAFRCSAGGIGTEPVDAPGSHTIAVRFPRPHEPEHSSYAVADPAAQDFGRDRGYWWSPDGRWIVFERTRPTATSSGDAPNDAYMAAGAQLPAVDLGIVSAAGGAPVWVRWDLARYPYLARVIWTSHAPLTLLVLSRDQTELAVLRADPATGAARVLLTEHDPAWVDVAPSRLTWLAEGSGFLWMSETDDGWTLWQHGASGARVRQVIAASFGLRDVVGVTPGGDVIALAATDPREQHVWRVPLGGGAPVALTSGGGVHQAMTRHGLIVVTSRLRAGGTRVAVLDDHGRRDLPGVVERSRVKPTTVIEDLAVGDHRQYIAITRPRSLQPGRRYPVILNMAGDPAHQAVVDARDEYLLDQWIADAGFIVVRTDGRGTPYRGHAWSRAIAGDVVTQPLADQIAGLAAAETAHPELDGRRVGVLGTGYGGHLAAMAVLTRPDRFAAASLTTPILDWRQTRIARAERYLRRPQDNLARYVRASATALADKLSRPLLVFQDKYDRETPALRAFVAQAVPAHHLVDVVWLPSKYGPAPPMLPERTMIEFFRAHLTGT